MFVSFEMGEYFGVVYLEEVLASAESKVELLSCSERDRDMGFYFPAVNEGASFAPHIHPAHSLGRRLEDQEVFPTNRLMCHY